MNAGWHTPEKREQFRKHLKNVFHIIDLKRTNNVPPRVNGSLLEKVEGFINRIIQVYELLGDHSGSQVSEQLRLLDSELQLCDGCST